LNYSNGVCEDIVNVLLKDTTKPIRFKESSLKQATQLDFIRNLTDDELLCFIHDTSLGPAINFDKLKELSEMPYHLPIKLWIDDIRRAPDGYVWCKTTDDAIEILSSANVSTLDIDHDAGDFVNYGGDYIKVLDWMEEHDYKNIDIHIHSMNPVGIAKMKQIIAKNNWTLIE
jgi:hypothetical protein